MREQLGRVSSRAAALLGPASELGKLTEYTFDGFDEKSVSSLPDQPASNLVSVKSLALTAQVEDQARSGVGGVGGLGQGRVDELAALSL